MFTNRYLGSFDHANIRVSFTSAAVDGDAFGMQDVDHGGFVYNGETVASVSVSNNPAMLAVQFNQHATVAAVEKALRSITFESHSSTPQTRPRELTIVFSHTRFGTTKETLLLQVWPAVANPWPSPRILNACAWLPNSRPTILAGRRATASVIFDASNLLIGDWPFVNRLQWETDLGEAQSLFRVIAVVDAAIVTNNIPAGFHWAWLSVFEEQVQSTPAQPFEVVESHDAFSRLIFATRRLNLPHRSQLVLPLRAAAAAVLQRKFHTARSNLATFQSRLTAMVAPTQPEAAKELSKAAESLATALSE